MADPFVFDLVGCARCEGEGHLRLLFQPFGLPPDDLASSEFPEGRITHWALCPTTGEPILFMAGPQPDGA